MRQNKLKFNIGRIIAVLLAVLLLVPAVPAVYADEIGGKCGDGVEWNIENAILTVSGKGEIPNYPDMESTPWAKYRDEIVAVSVGEGVTSIGEFAFAGMKRLTTASLSSTVETVGGWAFYEDSDLLTVDLASVTEIGESAFDGCASLSVVRLPSTLKTLGFRAFFRCESLLGIVVPASVTTMEMTVFAYCKSLRTAVINASIKELPTWTFFGCDSLSSITIGSQISSVGNSTFGNCYSLTSVSYGGSADISDKLPASVTDYNSKSVSGSSGIQSGFVTESTDSDGNSVTVSGSYTESENGIISSEVTHTKGESQNSSSIKIEAVIEQPSAWEDLHSALVDSMQDREYSSQKETMDVTVHLKGEPELKKEHLSYFAGKDLTLSVHTEDGATWRFNGTDISASALEESYKLSYTLTRIEEPTEKQREVIGLSGYLVVFDHDFNIRTELLLPLGEDLARDTAVFFAPEKKEYLRMQASIIDREGIAHFYLEKIKADIEYLIGINIPNRDAAANEPQDAIIPEELKDEYPNIEQIEPIEYVITGRKSSWGLSGNQVTLILAGVMIMSIIVVGVIVYIMFKAKHRNYYDPVLDGAPEKEANAKPKKEKSEPAPKKDKPESKAKKSTKKK